MLNWLIIGGGLQGTYLSNVLTGTCSVDHSKIRVLDPNEQAFSNWLRNTRNTGMTHLRSPSVHHIGLDPRSLEKFSHRWREARCWIAPYRRPSLAMFNAHCQEIIKEHQLDELRVQGTARSIELQRNHVCVETDRGALRAKKVVMALGTPPPSVPKWAVSLQKNGAPIEHLFSENLSVDTLETSGLTLIVGGGISAAQFAVQMVERGAEQVVVLARTKPRVHQFDADPGWLGPKYMNRFKRENPHVRRQLITSARHKGSMPNDVYRRLRHYLQKGTITWKEGEVDSAGTEDGLIMVRSDKQLLIADRLILATGFRPAPPGMDLLEPLHREHGLALGKCGYPITDRFLRWHPRLFLTGGQGELTLGPIARNIAGGRRAGNAISSLIMGG